MAKEKNDLLIIDPQFDFCDPTGALSVPGADEDMARLAAFIDKFGEKLNQIHVTLDCHYYYDIAHWPMWRNSEGRNPDPFTLITHQMVVDSVWWPVLPTMRGKNSRQHAKEYTKALEDGKRKVLCLWPPHCLIGTDGNKILPPLAEALQSWQRKKKQNVNYVSKGSNILTEHYSAVRAEVPDPDDESTQLNVPLITNLEHGCTKLYVGGEAGSHCVPDTSTDIADGFNDPKVVEKMVFLEDCMSPVPATPDVDFPAIQEAFLEDMKNNRGASVAKTTDII